jgi:hypothetical protein
MIAVWLLPETMLSVPIGTHAPFMHVPPVQGVPSLTLTIVSPQVGAPVAHEIAPAWHELAGVHDAPEVQLTHAPDELQTMPVPHELPAPTGVPVSAHTGDPVLQAMKPTSHGLPTGVHDAPAWQVTHMPPAQTMPEPHEVPSG